MKITSILTLLMAATAITIDAAPLGGVSTISLKKSGPLPSYFTPTEKFNIHVNHALLKYQKNIKKAYADGLIDKDVISRLELALQPIKFGTSLKKKGKKGGKGKGKKGGKSKGGKNSSDSSSNSDPTTDPLTDEGNDVGYHGAITIGGQDFTVIFDTGSADLWVPGPDCSDSSCKSHKKFDPNQSKTFKTDNQPFNITYGTGNVDGIVGTDDVSVGSLTAKSQIFGITKSESDDFTNQDADGILGMAFDKLSAQGAMTPFNTMVKQNSVAKSQFGFLLGRKKDGSDSQVTLGGVDSSKFTGSIAFNDLVSNVGFWEIALDDASVNGKPLGFKGKTAVIDTGTTLLIVPPEDAAKIHKAIPGAVDQGQGQFDVPCDTKAVVSMSFGGVDYKINVKDLAFDTDHSNLCVSGIGGGNIGGPDQWLVGDTFLKNVYSVFDADKNAVGFASLSN